MTESLADAAAAPGRRRPTSLRTRRAALRTVTDSRSSRTESVSDSDLIPDSRQPAGTRRKALERRPHPADERVMKGAEADQGLRPRGDLSLRGDTTMASVVCVWSSRSGGWRPFGTASAGHGASSPSQDAHGEVRTPGAVLSQAAGDLREGTRIARHIQPNDHHRFIQAQAKSRAKKSRYMNARTNDRRGTPQPDDRVYTIAT
mmetsp:Transcript_9869/g.29018  ORF Transcript_9869/g.29018 Transcript_9869/m.29018 type:complete len:203 (+) Transcript_9869:329-937(+)